MNEILFLLQINDGCIKIVKCIKSKKAGLKISCFCFSAVSKDTQEINNLAVKHLKECGFKNNKLIVSLKRNLITSRFLKVPSVNIREIEDIAQLQSVRFLPYPSQELISGFDYILKDKSGFSCINLTVAHKNVAEKFVEIFNKLRPSEFYILPDASGINSLFNYLFPQEKDCSLIIDIDNKQAEILIILNKKVAFSRSFLITPGDISNLAEETKKTIEAYSKEVGMELPAKLYIMLSKENQTIDIQALADKLNMQVETIFYEMLLTLEFLGLRGNVSFSGLLGFALTSDLAKTENLLPQELKQRIESVHIKREFLKFAGVLVLAFLFLIAGTAKHLSNKTRYLNLKKVELAGISKDSKKLEAILLKQNPSNPGTSNKIDTLKAMDIVFASLPEGIVLSKFEFNDGKIIIRGQTQNLSTLFSYVKTMESLFIPNKITPTIKYATRRAAQSGEIIDFEVNCI